MKNQRKQFGKEQMIVSKSQNSSKNESYGDSNQQANEQLNSKKLSVRLKSFLENLDMSFRRIDAGLM